MSNEKRKITTSSSFRLAAAFAALMAITASPAFAHDAQVHAKHVSPNHIAMGDVAPHQLASEKAAVRLAAGEGGAVRLAAGEGGAARFG